MKITDESISLERRITLDLVFWLVLIVLIGLMVYLYLVFPLMLFPVFLVFVFVARLLIINNRLGVKQQKEQKQHKK